MNNKKIFAFLIIFLIASFFYLAYIEQKQQDLDYQKNWWTLYFEDPKIDNLNFVIENHSDNDNFHWEVFKDKEKIEENDIGISKGRKASVDLSAIISDKGKMAIIVSGNNEKKEIYKYLNQ